MGTAISSIVTGRPISTKELAHCVLAVDAYNILYQFLTTIRTPDGSPLKNSKGVVTSHIIGLLSRIGNLMEEQAKLVFVFDGQAPELKKAERERRKALKIAAEEKYLEATADKDTSAMKKYAARSARLTSEMIEDAKRVLTALGIPWIQAPSEGEAQASHLVRKGDADYVVSQDMDCLLYGAPKFIKNLSLSGKRKRPGTATYYKVEPELLELSSVLQELDLTHEQLVCLGMLVGTDFNPGGIKGIGPKKALKLVQEYQGKKEELFSQVEWSQTQASDWKEVYELITNMPVSDDYHIEFSSPSQESLQSILVDEFEFSQERIDNLYNKIQSKQQQKGLRDFF